MSDAEITTPTPEAVEFADFSLRPSRYAESSDEGGLTIAFQATLTATETERLRALQADDGRAYRPVTRRGIDGDPIEMRFGQILWQPLEDGSIDHQITLVSKQYDDNQADAPFVGLGGEPEQRHLIKMVSRLSAQIDALLDGIESGAVTPDLARKLRDAGDRGEQSRKFIFYEVDDLAHWWLD